MDFDDTSSGGQAGDDEGPLPPLEVPKEALSADALRGVVDNYIMREGTDYGVAEVSYETKFKQVCRQIEGNEIKIVFDPNTETVTLMTKAEWNRYSKPSSV